MRSLLHPLNNKFVRLTFYTSNLFKTNFEVLEKSCDLFNLTTLTLVYAETCFVYQNSFNLAITLMKIILKNKLRITFCNRINFFYGRKL